AKKAESCAGVGARRTLGLATFKQHFLNFLPLPHEHGSFLPIFILGIIAESCHLPLTNSLMSMKKGSARKRPPADPASRRRSARSSSPRAGMNARAQRPLGANR